MSEKYLRIRIQDTAIPQDYPFKLSYLCKTRGVETYKAFGPSFSVRLSDAAYAALKSVKVNHRVVDREAQKSEIWDGACSSYMEYRNGYIVVPLRFSSPTKIHSITSPRLHTRYMPRSPDGLPRTAYLQRLAAAIPGTSALLHLATGDYAPCLLCAMQTASLTGSCTVGCHDCAVYMEIPRDSATRDPSRCVRSPSAEGKRALPTL